jgi:hypothetical protein
VRNENRCLARGQTAGKENIMLTFRKSVRLLLPILAVVFALSTATNVYASPGLLDGKTFVGQTGEKGSKTGDKEEFVFANGTFDPLACHKFGFSVTSYTTQAEGKTITFIADHYNKKGYRMLWKGSLTGNRLEGVMTYTEGKVSKEYWFWGELRPQ